MPSLIKDTLYDLQKLGIRPSKSLGQNFLVDENVVRLLIKLANLRKSDIIIEVGRGLGVLTEKILEIGATLFAIELDRNLFEFLREKFSQYQNFNIVNGDAVEFPTASITNDVKDYKIVSNLPYAISSAWMDNLLSCNYLPSEIHLIIQSETSERYFASCGTKDFCPIAIFLQSAYGKLLEKKISRMSFYPLPAVDSVIVSMCKKSVPFLFKKDTKQCMRDVFTKRRKQIFGISKSLPHALEQWIYDANIPKTSRPEDIAIDQWQMLDSFFENC